MSIDASIVIGVLGLIGKVKLLNTQEQRKKVQGWTNMSISSQGVAVEAPAIVTSLVETVEALPFLAQSRSSAQR